MNANSFILYFCYIIKEENMRDGILIIVTESTYPGCVVPSRVIEYFTMRDNKNEDYKLISVVAREPRFKEIKELSDISTFTLK